MYVQGPKIKKRKEDEKQLDKDPNKLTSFTPVNSTTSTNAKKGTNIFTKYVDLTKRS
jgi:hypothetical protein